MTKEVRSLWLVFDDGDNGDCVRGSWNLPDPKVDPTGFLRISESIGFTIAHHIASGAKMCAFRSGEMPTDFRTPTL